MIIAIATAMALLMIICFSFVLLFGAPFLPTLKPQINEALDLLNLDPVKLYWNWVAGMEEF